MTQIALWSTPPIAHAGHYITTIAYFLPVVAFLVWLAVTQIRERRSRNRG
jgi:hypothetical protein